MHVLVDPRRPSRPGTRPTAAELRELYAFPAGRRWMRSNFVTTLDGSVQGADGRSGSVNTPADRRVFALQRELCEAVLVGSGTARAEGYERVTSTRRRADPPALVVVSGAGRVPDGLAAPVRGRGAGILVTRAAAGQRALDRARDALGRDAVVVAGDERVDLAVALDVLADRGLRHVLCEGGPTLFSAALAAGVVDEASFSVVPTLIGGNGIRVAGGALLGAPDGIALTLRLLVEEAGTLLGLWRVHR